MRIAFISIMFFLLSCSSEVPDFWQEIGIPSNGLAKVYDNSDSNGFYADYIGYTSSELITLITLKLTELGFSEVCSEFGGKVKGFENKDQKYIVKVDALGERVGLSIFNENGAEPLLYGLCFKGYKLSNPIHMK